MKKNCFIVIFIGLFFVTSLMFFSACNHADSHTHSYVEETTASTCTEQGFTTYTCHCGESYVDNYVDSLGHSYTIYVSEHTPATCLTNRIDSFKCERCSEMENREIPDTETGHSFTNYVHNNDAKCEEDGTVKAMCDNGCGASDIRVVDDSALGHSYTVYVSERIPATCTANRIDTYKCERCVETEDKEIPNTANGHNYIVYLNEHTPATCIANSIGTYRCENCTETENREIPDSSTGHSYIVYLSEHTPATCTTNRIGTYRCENCAETENREVFGTTTGHNFTNYIYNNDATYESDGTKTAYCENGCGESDIITAEGTMLESRIEFATLRININDVSGKFSYETASFNFNNEIVVYGIYTYEVSSDADGNNPYPTNIVTLQEGENIFFVTVKDGDEIIKQYKILLYRNHLYTVSFDVAGGSEVEPQLLEEGSFATAPTTTKTGYTLSWDYDFSTPIMNDILITAEWTITEYTITYNCYTDVVETATYTIETETFSLMTPPTREGYTFFGWCTSLDASGTIETQIEKGTTGDKVYYGRWLTIKYKLTYVYDEGKTTTDEFSVLSSFQLRYPNYTVKLGYEFRGWYTSPTEGTRVYKIEPGTIGDRTYYARWKIIKYTITYNQYYGETAIANADYTITNDSSYAWKNVNGILNSTNHDYNTSSIYKITAKVDMTVSFYYMVSSHEGYDELFIRKNSQTRVEVSGEQTSYTYYTVELSAGDVLTFKYKKTSYGRHGSDCAFIKDMTCKVVNKTTTAFYTIEDEVTLPTPTRPGHTFVGWYTNLNSNEKVTKIEKGSYGNVTYYARWVVK